MVIDKSVLQRIAELHGDEHRRVWSIMRGCYQVIIPQVLIDEVLVNRGDPRVTPPEVVAVMWNDLLELKAQWLLNETERAFQELVRKNTSAGPIMMPSEVAQRFSAIDPQTDKFTKFCKKRELELAQSVAERLRSQNEAATRRSEQRFSGDNPEFENGNVFFIVESELEFFEKFVLLGTQARTRQPYLWLDTLKSLGDRMKKRYGDEVRAIDLALESLSTEVLVSCPGTYSLLLSKLFYIWAPLVRIRQKGHTSRRILGRGEGSQRGNLHDERYVGAALLSDGLLTCDRDMARVAQCFINAGRWKGILKLLTPAKGQSIVHTIEQLQR